ncbi:MAG: glycerophosphodiester phosphodiesterase [Phycisphaerales bacterium]
MRIIAHRGASRAEPENTAAAFDAALADGADGIELDLQLSRDGEVVVFHDATLARLGLRRARIRDHDWLDLASLDVGRWFTGQATSHRMLRLADVLAGWGGRTHLYLEIKHAEGWWGRDRHRELAERTAETVRAAGLIEHVSILSFHGAALDAVHALVPTLALVRNVQQPGLLASAVRQRARLAAICVAIDRFGERQRARLAALDRPVYVYTCDTPSQFQRARVLGATAVISNNPAAARRWFEAEAPA